MEYKEFAEKYLQGTGLVDDDDLYHGELAKAVMRLVEVHSAEGHSGNSAHWTDEIFHDLNQAYIGSGKYREKKHKIWQEFWDSPEGQKLQADVGTPGVMNAPDSNEKGRTRPQ